MLKSILASKLKPGQKFTPETGISLPYKVCTCGEHCAAAGGRIHAISDIETGRVLVEADEPAADAPQREYDDEQLMRDNLCAMCRSYPDGSCGSFSANRCYQAFRAGRRVEQMIRERAVLEGEGK